MQVARAQGLPCGVQMVLSPVGAGIEPRGTTLLGAGLRAAWDCGPKRNPRPLTPCPLLLSVPGNQVFPEVTRLLTSHTGNTSNSEDILSSACYTVRNLMASQPQMAKQYFSSNMINNVINLCRSRWVGWDPCRPARPQAQP